MSIKMSFHGAVEGVTGSCHLLEAAGLRILIDCGLFQGGRDGEARNRLEMAFDPASIDYLLLTHGHLDHCGRIPLLVKRGFRGKIICTPATYDIAKVVLMDSARIQEEDNAIRQKRRVRSGLPQEEPLYTSLDALDSLRYFRPKATYDVPFDLNDRLTANFRDAGHILGAAFIELTVKNDMRIIYSGDLGNPLKPIIRDPSMPHDADVVVVETTYADRLHKGSGPSVDELLRVIKDTFARGGNVVIPSFSVERAQELLYYFSEFHRDKKLPACQVYLDSPMAINVSKIVRRHPECYDADAQALFSGGRDPLDFPGLEFTQTAEESRRINFIKGGAIIIAGSGMCTGGRIRHHLKHNIWRPESSLVFVGFQAQGTLGRSIVDKEDSVKIFGESYKLRAQVHTIGGFSSHADRDTILSWLRKTNNPDHLFLVHGEQEAIDTFRQTLAAAPLAKNIHDPKMAEEFTL